MTDLYFKMPEDTNYSSEEIEVVDMLECFLQQIEMILTTRRGDVLGYPKLGANLEDYLWSTRVSSNQVKTEIMTQIQTYSNELASQFKYDIEVNFMKGEITDSLLVDIIVNGTKYLGIAATAT